MANKTVTKTKSKSWPKIGTIRKSDKGTYVKFADNVKILVDDVEIKLNDSRTANLVDPVSEVQKLIERGIIKEADAETRLEKAQEASSWLRYEIVCPPPMEKK